MQAVSDWLNGIILATSFSLTGNRCEYRRVVGIHSDG